MTIDLGSVFASELSEFENYLKAQAEVRSAPIATSQPQLKNLNDAINYSLFSGGKRFRPLLSMLTARALNHPIDRVFPVAAAVELIHTYSLIHDDLPMMDNDDWRRDQPTNHKVYGEGVALLAGDALLAEAFYLLALAYYKTPHLGLAAVEVIARAAGISGMVGGQAMDIQMSQEAQPDLKMLEQIHQMKTGALILASVHAAALVCEASDENMQSLVDYGRHIGFAFQLADDLLDHKEDSPEWAGFPRFLGVEKTKAELSRISVLAIEAIKPLGESAQGLRQIVEFNLSRTL